MKYTVYLSVLQDSKYVHGDIVHVSLPSADEDEIIAAAIEDFYLKRPELNEWAIKAHLILEGHITPFSYSK